MSARYRTNNNAKISAKVTSQPQNANKKSLVSHQGPKGAKQPAQSKPSTDAHKVKSGGLRAASTLVQPRLPAGGEGKPLTLSVQNRRRGKPYKPHKDNLRSKSQWWKSISDPLHGGSCKIPDDVGVETGTLQCTQAFTFNATTGTDGGVYGGIQVFSPYPGTDPDNPAGENWQYLNNASSSKIDIQWEGTTHALDTNGPLRSYSQGLRVVSYALMVEPEASLSSASGEMTLFQTPWSYSGGGEPLYSYQNSYQSAIIPLNRSQPMQTNWYPVNKENCNYTVFYPAETDGTLGTKDTNQRPWGLGCIVTGCPNNTTFRGLIVVNYEFIPLENSVDILSAMPSRIDVVEQQLVESWVADSPKTKPISVEQISSGPAVVPETPDPTGFGMFADVIKEVLPYAIEGIGMLL